MYTCVGVIATGKTTSIILFLNPATILHSSDRPLSPPYLPLQRTFNRACFYHIVRQCSVLGNKGSSASPLPVTSVHATKPGSSKPEQTTTYDQGSVFHTTSPLSSSSRTSPSSLLKAYLRPCTMKSLPHYLDALSIPSILMPFLSLLS